MSSTNKTPENSLVEAQDYLKSLELPEGFTFELHHNGKKTFVLEDVSEEKDWIKTIDGYLEKDKKTLSEQVEAFNGNDDYPILKNQLKGRVPTMENPPPPPVKKPCCGNNCKIKGSSKPITKESFLKNKLNDVKTPEAFFNYLEDILKREQLMIEDLKKFLTDLKESFMTTEKAKDYEYRENYVFFMYCLFNDILDNMERMTL